MKESLGHRVTEPVREQARARDAPRVGDDRDGHRREDDERPAPQRRLREVRVGRRHRDEGQQRPHAAAGLGDFQLGVGERDDVALAQDGHVEQLQGRRGRAGREQLQRERDRVDHDGRRRNHEQQIDERKLQ